MEAGEDAENGGMSPAKVLARAKTGTNYLAVETTDEAGGTNVTAWKSIMFKGHSEKLFGLGASDAGVDMSQVTRLYSEFEPCQLPGAYCANLLARILPEGTKVTWSWEYGDAASRVAGRAAKADDLAEVFDDMFE